MVKAITENSHSAPGQECPSSDDRGWLVSSPANIREGPGWANDRRSYNSCVQAIRLTGTDYQMLRDGFGKRIGIGKASVFKMWFQMVPTRFTCTKSVSIKGYQRSLMFLVRNLHESTTFYNHFNKRKSATLWCPEAQFTHCCFRPAPMRHRITIKFHSIKVSQLYLCGSFFIFTIRKFMEIVERHLTQHTLPWDSLWNPGNRALESREKLFLETPTTFAEIPLKQNSNSHKLLVPVKRLRDANEHIRYDRSMIWFTAFYN